MTQVHFMSCLKSRPIEVVSGGWVYESADGTMVVGKSCSAGVEPEPPSDALVEVSVLPLLELSEPVCAGDAALEVLLGAILRDWVLAYQYGLVVAVDEADEDAESSDDADDEEDWGLHSMRIPSRIARQWPYRWRWEPRPNLVWWSWVRR